MTNNRDTKKHLIAAVGLQFALLIGLTVQPISTLITGRVITLRTVPVDPYDMFRGDYVRLSYDMSNFPVPFETSDNSDIYATLSPAGQNWKVRAISAKKPVLLEGEICIKGKVKKQYGRTQLHFGIEQVYVPEKTGGKAEQAKALIVDLAVDKNGNAVIKRVMNGSETIYDANNLLSVNI